TFKYTLPTEIYTLSLHDALPISDVQAAGQEEQVEIDDWMLDQIPMEDLETYWHHIQSNYGAFIDELSNKNLKELLKQYDHISFRSEEHTSELQSRFDLVCRLLLE